MVQVRQSATASRLDHALELALFNASALLLILIACAVFYGVIARYIFNEPPLWSEDAPLVFFLWMTYLALAVATKRGENIRVTFIIERFRPLPRLVLELTMHTLVIVMIVVLFWYSFPIIELNLAGNMLSTGWSYAVNYIPLPVGCVFMTLYQLFLIRKSLREYQKARSV